MTAQVATLQLSQALAVEMHGLFRALDLRIRTPELIRDKLDAVALALDELLETEWSLPEAIAESIERIAEFLRSWAPDDTETWADLKAQLREIYAGFATALRQERVRVPELRPANYTRSVFHIGSAALCLALILVLSPIQLVWAACGIALTGWTLEALRRISPRANVLMMAVFRPVAHQQEWHRINSATWYVSALALLSLTFSPLLCVIAVAVLGLGDPLAGLVGRRFGRIRLVNGRSLEGSLTFVVVGTLAAMGAMQLVEPSLVASLAWITALAAACTGAIAELLSRRIDDNLSIPIVSAATAALVMALLGLSPWA